MPWAREEPLAVAGKTLQIRQLQDDFVHGRAFTYGIFDGQERRPLGGIGYHRTIGDAAADIGYWLDVEEVGKGFVAEAAAALVQLGFEREGVRLLEVHCHPDNHRSAAVPQRLGFELFTTISGWVASPHAEPRDTQFWRLTRRAYELSPARKAVFETMES